MNKLIILVELDGSNNDPQFSPTFSRNISAHFNPSRLSISRTVPYPSQQQAQTSTPATQFVGADPSTLSLELFFDTYDTPSKEKDSVREKHVKKLVRLTVVDGEKHRPRVCRLQWGEQSILFQGVLTQLETQYTLFLEDGTPVRATCRCTFREWERGITSEQRANLMSADVAKVWLVKQGQTLPMIAAREYGDPREWRAIAEANDLDDPGALRPGTLLSLPARQVPWRRSS